MQNMLIFLDKYRNLSFLSGGGYPHFIQWYILLGWIFSPIIHFKMIIGLKNEMIVWLPPILFLFCLDSNGILKTLNYITKLIIIWHYNRPSPRPTWEPIVYYGVAISVALILVMSLVLGCIDANQLTKKHLTAIVQTHDTEKVFDLKWATVLRALSSLRGLRGAPEVPPLCRETAVSRTANVGTVGMNGLS